MTELYLLHGLWALLSFSLLVAVALAAANLRRELGDVDPRVRIRILTGRAPAGGSQRWAMYKAYLLLALFIMSIVIPGQLIKGFASSLGGNADAVSIDSDVGNLLKSGELVPVEFEPGRFGIRVGAVASGGLLEESGFQRGDLIVAIDEKPMTSLGEAIEGIATLSAKRPAVATVRTAQSGESARKVMIRFE